MQEFTSIEVSIEGQVVSSFHKRLVDSWSNSSYISDMKTLVQTDDEQQTVAMLRALANPSRFRIVQLLAARDACVCGELVHDLPLAQSTVSEHLKVLKDAGLVQGTIEGPNTCYCLDRHQFQVLADTFASFQNGSCC
jgi:ArsR family transcriptional regulator, arsenate/arsenite/antimonite-responsive transcriptional repressor